MRNRLSAIIIILCTISFYSCQKKDLDIKLEESECNGFKISNPAYEIISEPSCSGSPLNASFRVKVSYKGKKKCLYLLKFEPKFFTSANLEIANISFSDTIHTSNPNVVVTDTTITFLFNFVFPDAGSAGSFDHLYLKFHTENNLGAESNDVEIRANGVCSAVEPSTYTVKSTVDVSSNKVTVLLRDYASQDGDIISISLNGQWVLENYTLTNTGESFTFNIFLGNNYLVVYANNQGTSGPNTCEITVNGATKTQLNPGLKTGEAINIVF
jgi:hypothetical protein